MLDTVAPLLTRVLCWQVLLPSFVVLYALLWVAQECGRRLSCPANAKLAPRLFSLPFIGYPMVIFTFPYHLDWFTPIHRKVRCTPYHVRRLLMSHTALHVLLLCGGHRDHLHDRPGEPGARADAGEEVPQGRGVH